MLWMQFYSFLHEFRVATLLASSDECALFSFPTFSVFRKIHASKILFGKFIFWVLRTNMDLIYFKFIFYFGRKICAWNYV